MLDGKRLLVTGVMTRQSIAFAVAERAQRSGAFERRTSAGLTRSAADARGLFIIIVRAVADPSV